jgi:aspartyl protease family protein
VCLDVGAVQVGLAGIVGNKAMLLIGGTTTRTIGIGQRTPEGIRLISIDRGEATLEIDGTRQSLRLGQNASGPSGNAQTAVLSPDIRGQYATIGSVNGFPVRFVVDTGATMVSIGASEAKRLGLSTVGADQRSVQTANGVISAQRVRLDNVTVGGISLEGVEALVQETDMPIALLGMSFLNRTDMQNEGGRMTLKKRY